MRLRYLNQVSVGECFDEAAQVGPHSAQRLLGELLAQDAQQRLQF